MQICHIYNRPQRLNVACHVSEELQYKILLIDDCLDTDSCSGICRLSMWIRCYYRKDHVSGQAHYYKPVIYKQRNYFQGCGYICLINTFRPIRIENSTAYHDALLTVSWCVIFFWRTVIVAYVLVGAFHPFVIVGNKTKTLQLHRMKRIYVKCLTINTHVKKLNMREEVEFRATNSRGGNHGPGNIDPFASLISVFLWTRLISLAIDMLIKLIWI